MVGIGTISESPEWLTIEYLIPEHLSPKGIGNPVGYRQGVWKQEAWTRAADQDLRFEPPRYEDWFAKRRKLSFLALIIGGN